MLNKLRCPTNFKFLANQITWSSFFLYKFTNLMPNGADPDQLASGSTLFAKEGCIQAQQDKG